MRKLELLAPAKNLECGIAAIDHGADAVYIGAPQFGARAAAGNTVEDIALLCRHAHIYGAKVYVTVNTLIFPHEIEDVLKLIRQLQEIHVDAILVQDLDMLQRARTIIDGGSMQIHASTQADNRTAQKVEYLRSRGFSRAVLARELSVAEIAEIHREVPDIELEVFVHGALCVSYSGLCFASEKFYQRSANRGECAQVCRMKFSLSDANGRIIEADKHLLSLKDLCLIDHLEELADAGAVSFKIEGRLKDIAYVKNVTAAYSEELNRIIARRPNDFCRASKGRCTYSFKPQLDKTFNRTFTNYFLHGRQPDIASFLTPKAVGEAVGRVKSISRDSIVVAGTKAFSNGDGLCFINAKGELEGFRVNRAEANRLFPLVMPTSLKQGTPLYRNLDQAFHKLLSKPSATRKIAVDMALSATEKGFMLEMEGEQIEIVADHVAAKSSPTATIERQLTKLGNTPYECRHLSLPDDFGWFLPAGVLNDLRRQAVEKLMARAEDAACQERVNMPATYEPLAASKEEPPLMQCRHCLRYALGYCVKHGGRTPQWKEPLKLSLADGNAFCVEFDCKHCQMNLKQQLSHSL